MNPRDLVVNAQGLPGWIFLRLWASTTTVPLRGDTQITDRSGRPTEAFQAIWRGAFNRSLQPEPIVKQGFPTQYLLNAWREAVG